MTDNEIIKAWDILAKLDFFGGQRAGRELWFEKPVDIQDEDIRNFSNDVAFLKDFIDRQKAEIERLEIQVITYSKKSYIKGIKDLAKRLKEKCGNTSLTNRILDDLADEMIGEQE
jgi:polyhydroxyalkanoate synthesis regulator phasin